MEPKPARASCREYTCCLLTALVGTRRMRGAKVCATARLRSPCCTLTRSIDPDRHVAVCEGRVTIEQLVDAAAKHGLVPAVIPEIHDFTVAGLINGLGIETSSHRYGGFFDTVTAMEVVLASGEVRHVDLASDKDLFDTLFGSYGESETLSHLCAGA